MGLPKIRPFWATPIPGCPIVVLSSGTFPGGAAKDVTYSKSTRRLMNLTGAFVQLRN